jgi:nitrilase
MVRVASVQAAPVAFDLKATLDKVGRLVQDAAAGGAELVVLPEAFCSGYPRFWGFAIGIRSDEQREWFARYVNVSLYSVDY